MSPKRAPVPAGGRRNRWVFPAVIGVIVLAGLLAVILSATGGSGGGSGGGTPKARVEVSAEVTVGGTALPRYTAAAKDPAVGLVAPTLGSVDFSGHNATAGGASGQPTVLAFVAHWCPHCQAEIPRIVALEKAGKASGVTIVAIPTGTDKTYPNYPPSAWLASEQWPGPVVLDDARQSAAQAYGLTGYPYLVFVDAQGKVVARTSGEIAEADLAPMLAQLAAGQPVTVPGAGASSNSGTGSSTNVG